MILSFRDKRTRQFAEGKRVKALTGFEMQAHKRLRLLHLVRHLQALRALPGNRLEALSGDRAGQYSIRNQRPVADLLRMAGRCSRPIEC